MYRILVVEDDPGIAQAVCAHLRQWELEARCVQNFRAVMDEFTAFDPQLVLLDISLPFFNGYHWCTQIRSVSRVPVMFLSSAAKNMNIVMAMNMGADDFIAKPFDLDVLTAKVQALLRRTYDFAAASPVLSHRGAVLQTGDQSLLVDGEKLPLSKNEYRILWTLLQDKGTIVSREKLMEALWQTDSFVDENTLSVNMARLRKKLDGAGLIGAFLLFALLFLVSFRLYHLPLAAVWYPSALCAALGLVILLLDFRRVRQRHLELQQILKSLPALPQTLPQPQAVLEEDYRALTRALLAQQRTLETQLNSRYQDMLDYYTLWAHQIKTPIASMRLSLQQEDTPKARQLLQELSRAEQYVGMVMVYLRLTDGGSDFVLRTCDLDAIVRQAVRRFAGEFITRKLKLCYEPLNAACVTDEKWLLFVVEQVLSNALKYTREGSITITMEHPKTLVIRDTGIGIAPEDLPRIFEKGYTGYNGRGDQKASGLGLYLCRTICRKLGHSITAESALDEGTAIRIGLSQRQVRE